MVNQKSEDQKATLADLVKALTGKNNERLNSLEDSVRKTLDILVSGAEVKLTYPAEHTGIKVLKS